MKPGAQITVAGTPVTVLSGYSWRLPDGTVIRCRPGWGSPDFIIDAEGQGGQEVRAPRIIARSLHEAVDRHQQS